MWGQDAGRCAAVVQTVPVGGGLCGGLGDRGARWPWEPASAHPHDLWRRAPAASGARGRGLSLRNAAQEVAVRSLHDVEGTCWHTGDAAAERRVCAASCALRDRAGVTGTTKRASVTWPSARACGFSGVGFGTFCPEGCLVCVILGCMRPASINACDRDSKRSWWREGGRSRARIGCWLIRPPTSGREPARGVLPCGALAAVV
jgi:hypothetical protein